MVKNAGGIGLTVLMIGLFGASPAYAANLAATGQSSGNSWYDAIIEFAASTPGWIQSLGSLFTNIGLLIFVLLFGLALWHSRRTGDTRQIALAILAPVVTVLAYIVSEVSKSFIHEDRPCRGLAQSVTVLKCPDVGDWSFPSNHSTIAAAAAVGLLLAWRKLAPWVISIALLMAFSRVFVGAHYPHDVLVGLLLGAIIALIAVRLLLRKTVAMVDKFPAELINPNLISDESADEDSNSSKSAEPPVAKKTPTRSSVLGGAAQPTELLPRVVEDEDPNPPQRRAPQQPPPRFTPQPPPQAQNPRQARPLQYESGQDDQTWPVWPQNTPPPGQDRPNRTELQDRPDRTDWPRE